MTVLALGRSRLWFNSFYRAAMAIPLLFYLVQGELPFPLAFMFFTGLSASYFYTSAVNYVSDVEEDSRKSRLGRDWDRLNDPESPLVGREFQPGRLLAGIAAVYLALTGLALLPLWPPGPGWWVFPLHMAVLLVAGTAYSLGPRLKESAAGFFLASMLYWYPPLAMATVPWPPSMPLAAYLLALGVIGLHESVRHTLDHLKIDRGAGVRTLASIMGPGPARKTAMALGLLGHALLVLAGWLIHPALSLLALYCLLGHILTERPFWRTFTAALFIWLAVAAHPSLRTDPWSYGLALLAGLPMFTSPAQGLEMFRDSILGPNRDFLLLLRHRVNGWLRTLRRQA